MTRRPAAWTAAWLGATAVMATALPGLEIATDGDSLRPARHEAVRRTAEDAVRFREPDLVVMLVTADAGAPRLDSAPGLALLAALSARLRRVPEIDGWRARSPATLLAPPPPQGIALRTYFDDLPAGRPASPAEAAAVVARLRAHPLTDGLYLAADGRTAAFYLPLADRRRLAMPRDEALVALEERLADIAPAGVRLDLLGAAVAEARLGEQVLADLVRLLPAMLLAMALVLALTLRSPAGVLVPLVEAGVLLVWTLAAMALAGVPVTLVTTVVPVLLVTFSLAHEVHLLAAVSRRLDGETSAASGRPGRAAVVRALVGATAALGRPIVLTSLTTAAGFLSFLSADHDPVRHFGLFVALGILIALVLSFTLVPALATLLPPRWLVRRPWHASGRQDGGQDGRQAGGRGGGQEVAPWAAALVRHRRAAAAAAALAVLLLAAGAVRLRVQDSWIDNFAADSPLAAAEARANAVFWGTYRLDVVLDAGERDFFRRPQGVALAAATERLAAAAPHVGGVVSHLLPYRLVAEARRIGPAAGAVTDLDTMELRRVSALVEMATLRIDLRWFLTPDGEAARLRLLVNDADFARSRRLADHLESELPPLLAGSGVDWHLSGDLPVAVATVETLVGDQLRSIGWTLAALAVLLAAALASVRRAAALLAPVVAAVAAVLGGMGWLGMPLGIATSTFAALTLGVGIDFAIHLEAAVRRRRAAGLPPLAAVASGLEVAARPLTWTTAVTASGLAVLTVSTIPPNRHLALLLAAGIVASWAAAVTLLPALLARR